MSGLCLACPFLLHIFPLTAMQLYRAIRTKEMADAVLSNLDRWIPMLAIWTAFMTHTVIRQRPFPASTALIAPKM